MTFGSYISGRRPRGRRALVAVGSVGALVLMTVAVVSLTALKWRPTRPSGVTGTDRPQATVSDEPEAAAVSGQCPPTFTVPTGRPRASRTGQLVPTGATGALVCTYFAKDGGSALPLTVTQPLSGRPAQLVTYLNGLPDHLPEDPGRPQDEQRATACMLINTALYRIVLHYPDREPVLVDVVPPCGVVEQGGAVRFLRNVSELRGYWS
jgi:hypothetical protein